jgi:hypothetical protein
LAVAKGMDARDPVLAVAHDDPGEDRRPSTLAAADAGL